MEIIESLISGGWLKTPEIIAAFRKIKRRDFLPDDANQPKDLAEYNTALSIGFGQTISQPLVVAFMLELLSPKTGDKILDIGSGSGWTTALLAEIVGEKGKVFAIEIIPELRDFGEKSAAKYNFIDKGIAEFIRADGAKGYEKEAPFDKILVSASALKIPEVWKNQLKIGGKIAAVVKYSVWLLIKKSETEFEEKEYPGFSFVPLITK